MLVVENRTDVVLSNLYHYQDYGIEIIACHDYTPSSVPGGGAQQQLERQKLCSQRAIASHRTLPLPANDIIDIRNVTIENGTFANGTAYALIRWLEPPRPNGIILSYTLEVRKPGVADVSKHCVTVFTVNSRALAAAYMYRIVCGCTLILNLPLIT